MAAAADTSAPMPELKVVPLAKLTGMALPLRVCDEAQAAIQALPAGAVVVVVAMLGIVHTGKSTTMNGVAWVAMGKDLPAHLPALSSPFTVTGMAASTTHGIDMLILPVPEDSTTGITHVILLDVEGLGRGAEEQERTHLLAVAADALSTCLGFQTPLTASPSDLRELLSPIVAARTSLGRARPSETGPDKDLLLLSRGKPCIDFPGAENLTKGGGAPIGVAGMFQSVDALFLAPTRCAEGAESEALQTACSAVLGKALRGGRAAISKDVLQDRLTSLAGVFENTMNVADFGKTLGRNLITSVMCGKLVWQDAVDIQVPIDGRLVVLKGTVATARAECQTEERPIALDRLKEATASLASLSRKQRKKSRLHAELPSPSEVAGFPRPVGATLARIKRTRRECANLLRRGGVGADNVCFLRNWHNNLLTCIRRGDLTVAGTTEWDENYDEVVGKAASFREFGERDPRSFIAAEAKYCKFAEALLDPALAVAAAGAASGGAPAAGSALPTTLEDIDELVLADMLRPQALDAAMSTGRPDVILLVASKVTRFWNHFYGHMLPHKLGSAPPFKMWVDSDRTGKWAAFLWVAAARALNCHPDRDSSLFVWAQELDVGTLVTDGLVGERETADAMTEAGIDEAGADESTRSIATVLCALRNVGMKADDAPTVGDDVQAQDVMPLALLAAAARGKNAVSLVQVTLGCDPYQERISRPIILQARPGVSAGDHCGRWERSTRASGHLCVQVPRRDDDDKPGLRADALNAGAHLGHALAANGECILDFQVGPAPVPAANAMGGEAPAKTKSPAEDASLKAILVREYMTELRDSCALYPGTVAAVHGHDDAACRLFKWKSDLSDLQAVTWVDRKPIDMTTLNGAPASKLISAKASLRRADWGGPLFDMPGGGGGKAHLLLSALAKPSTPDDVIASLVRIVPQYVLSLPGPCGESPIGVALRDPSRARFRVRQLTSHGARFETLAQAEAGHATPGADLVTLDQFSSATSRDGQTELHYLSFRGRREKIARSCAGALLRAALVTRDARPPVQMWRPSEAAAGASATAVDGMTSDDDPPAGDDDPPAAGDRPEEEGDDHDAARAPERGSRLPPEELNPASALMALLEFTCTTIPADMTTVFDDDIAQHKVRVQQLKQLVGNPRMAGFVETVRLEMEHMWEARTEAQQALLRECLGDFAGGPAVGTSAGRTARQQLWQQLLHPTTLRPDETDGSLLAPMAAVALVRSEWLAQLQAPVSDVLSAAWAPEDGLAMELSPIAVEILSTAARVANWNSDTVTSMPAYLLSVRKLNVLGGVDSSCLPGLARALPNVVHLSLRKATSDGLKQLAGALSDWRRIETLGLQYATYDADAMAALGPALQSLPRLRTLRAGGVGEEGHPTTKLIECLAGMPSLQLLNLSGRRIDGSGATALASAVSRMGCLATLVLTRCEISAVGIKAIASALRGRRITALSLTGNSTVGQVAAEVIETVKHLSYLTSLKLASTDLGAGSALGLLEAVGKCGMLEELDLHGNKDLFSALSGGAGAGAASAAASAAGEAPAGTPAAGEAPAGTPAAGEAPAGTPAAGDDESTAAADHLLDALCAALSRCSRLRVIDMRDTGLSAAGSARVKALLPGQCKAQF